MIFGILSAISFALLLYFIIKELISSCGKCCGIRSQSNASSEAQSLNTGSSLVPPSSNDSTTVPNHASQDAMTEHIGHVGGRAAASPSCISATPSGNGGQHPTRAMTAHTSGIDTVTGLDRHPARAAMGKPNPTSVEEESSGPTASKIRLALSPPSPQPRLVPGENTVEPSVEPSSTDKFKKGKFHAKSEASRIPRVVDSGSLAIVGGSQFTSVETKNSSL